MLDMLSVIEDLKRGGYTQQQAEAWAKVLARLIEENIATKQDLKDLRFRLQTGLFCIFLMVILVLFTVGPLFLKFVPH